MDLRTCVPGGLAVLLLDLLLSEGLRLLVVVVWRTSRAGCAQGVGPGTDVTIFKNIFAEKIATESAFLTQN
jgi:hypothetical protein